MSTWVCAFVPHSKSSETTWVPLAFTHTTFFPSIQPKNGRLKGRLDLRMATCYFDGDLHPMGTILIRKKEINKWFIVGLGWWFGILGIHPSSNPFHKGITAIPWNHRVIPPWVFPKSPVGKKTHPTWLGRNSQANGASANFYVMSRDFSGFCHSKRGGKSMQNSRWSSIDPSPMNAIWIPEFHSYELK